MCENCASSWIYKKEKVEGVTKLEGQVKGTVA
jgi:hypothetical protein